LGFFRNGDSALNRTQYIARLVIFISLTIALEHLGLPQPITGPIVNLMLILTTLILNWFGGIILGCFTPVVAVLRGQLPAILIPMVPFIILGNAILVSTFSLVRACSAKRGASPLSAAYWTGIVIAAALKCSFLYVAARLILPVIVGRELPAQYLAMMAAPQFFTALLGGSLALLAYRMLPTIHK
jgi:hypothetical protein